MVPEEDDEIVNEILFGKDVVEKNRHQLPAERHAHLARIARELLDELAINLRAKTGRRVGFAEDLQDLEGELEAVHVVSTSDEQKGGRILAVLHVALDRFKQ